MENIPENYRAAYDFYYDGEKPNLEAVEENY